MKEGEARRPARQGDHAKWNVDLRHIACGTRVASTYTGHYECTSPECHVKWKAEIIAAFPDAEMAQRFYVVEPGDADDYVLVSRLDEFSKRAYTSLVKRSELRETDTKVALG